MVEKRIFNHKHKFSQKNKNLNLGEHVLLELRISDGFIISLYSIEVIVLLLGVKVMTFVLYPMFWFQEIVKYCNATESFAFEDGIGDECQIR